MENITVCGGGITGMVFSILLAQKGYKITLLETSGELGGLYRSIEVAGWKFDQGLYIPQLTGVSRIDQILLSSCDVKVSSGSNKDIAGNVFQKIHNENSLFIDARLLSAEQLEKIVFEMIERITEISSEIRYDRDMETYFNNRFGPEAVKSVFQNLSKHIWKKDLKFLSSVALKVVHMPRMVIFDQEVSRVLKESSQFFDERIAYPDQMKIPDRFIEGKTSSFYPKKFGLYHVLDGLRKLMHELNIDIKLNSKIENIEVSGNKVTKILVNQASIKEVMTVDGILWCAATEVLHKLLGFTVAPLSDKPIPHRTHYVISKTKPKAGRVYWSWDFDDNDVIRISFPYNYCSELEKNGMYPIMIEAHDNPKMNESERKEWLVGYLEEMGLVVRADIMNVYSPESAQRQFFVPSLDNINRDQKIISDIDGIGVENLYFCSAKIADGIFYLHDLLIDGNKRISGLMEKTV
jgi:protoporphyrinogen oxidase